MNEATSTIKSKFIWYSWIAVLAAHQDVDIFFNV